MLEQRCRTVGAEYLLPIFADLCREKDSYRPIKSFRVHFILVKSYYVEGVLWV